MDCPHLCASLLFPDPQMMSLGISPFPKGTGDLISGIVGGLTLTNHDGSIIPVKNLSSEIEVRAT